MIVADFCLHVLLATYLIRYNDVLYITLKYIK